MGIVGKRKTLMKKIGGMPSQPIYCGHFCNLPQTYIFGIMLRSFREIKLLLCARNFAECDIHVDVYVFMYLIITLSPYKKSLGER